MSVVDLVVLAVVLIAALRGWRRGGTGLVLRVAGAVGGVLLAGALARWFVPLLVGPDAAISRGALLLGAALVGALVGWGLGRRLGEALARRTGGGWRRPGLPDRVLGVAAHGALALMLLVLAAGVAAAVGPAGLGDAARDSALLGAAAERLPDPLVLLPSTNEATLADGGVR
ncbi:CvpA family protein [Actinomycetospora cinnamomea]|uniref:Putative membrane protein required for colicin V production n=1 Tax=Actinomycetospora cinnamomea TaxID=663609 RepID=A0A2U1EBI9_9PSEU|nr:CvpA family protein [Actinomycetospora cinnamomea]PVY97280.1 putative membrane protein required for colicin V production [Actinomycetospora cinnamomea]